MKKVLVTGANGFIARNILKQIDTGIFDVTATSRSSNIQGLELNYISVDLTDRQALSALLKKVQPEIVIHTAGVTSVDYASQHPEETQIVNVHATETIARWCSENQARLVHFSTDFVFDGKKGLYHEKDEPAPLSNYGASKWASERIVTTLVFDHVIIRPVLVYGEVAVGQRLNFPVWVVSRLQAGLETFITGDQFRAPTYVHDLAKVTVMAAFSDFTGLLHVSGPESVSIIDFARMTARAFELDENLLVDVKTEQLDQSGVRPMKTAFTNELAIKHFAYAPTLPKVALDEMYQSSISG